jgi:hypothetical protein
MSTTTRVPRRRKPDRKIRLTRPIQQDTAGVVVITSDGVQQAYMVSPLPCDFGKAFRVGKVELVPTEPDQPPQAKVTASYDVNLNGALSLCSCLGFLRWQRCKHVSGLSALCERNLL